MGLYCTDYDFVERLKRNDTFINVQAQSIVKYQTFCKSIQSQIKCEFCTTFSFYNYDDKYLILPGSQGSSGVPINYRRDLDLSPES